MNKHLTADFHEMFREYHRAIEEKEEWEQARERQDQIFSAACKQAEKLAAGMNGFNKIPGWHSPVNGHTGEAHFFINGFAGMPIKLVNPRAFGPEAIAAFKNGRRMRAELGVQLCE